LITLLHVLIFVYWLGGDLGAFYSSTILTDAKQPVAARAAAAKVLSNIDMAPRTALILAAPTGLSLSFAKGWWDAPHWLLVVLWIVALGWLALAWVIHVKHLAPSSAWRRLDLVIRWLALVKFTLIALAPQILPFVGELPLFIRLKFAILAAAIGCGLFIRVTLAPFGAAFGGMLKNGATPETDAAIAKALDQSRPIVLILWALLLCAAFLGIATPV
jgi:hypothetical protein